MNDDAHDDAETDANGANDANGASGGASSDVVVVGGPTDDGAGARVLRVRDRGVSVGEIRPLAEGKPIHGEVVALTPRADAPRICDVRTLHGAPPSKAEAPTTPPEALPLHAGPPRVASSAYRAGWEAIFAKKPSDPRMN